jgi:tetratricopeptide (TPR) repeat protein
VNGTRGPRIRRAASVLVVCAFSVAATIAAVNAQESLQRAAMLVERGRLDEAEQQARAALADPATQAAANTVLGVIRFQQKRLDESRAFLSEAIRLEPRLIGAHLNLAFVHALQAQPALALERFRRVVELDARLTGVPHASVTKLALLLIDTGAARQALEVLETLERAAGPSYELSFNLASAYLLNHTPGRALEAYDRALTLKPDSTAALRQAAAVAERQGELERSLSYWIRARKLEPEDPEVLLGFGRVCLRMDLLDDAEPALVKAASLKPGDSAYQYTLAAAKVGKRQYDAAQRLLEELVAARPEDAQLQYGLGSILYIRGHLADAAARLRESVRLQPGQLASNYYLALVARDQGNDAEAAAMLETLLRRYPDHAPSNEALGGLLMTAQRYVDAERHLRNAVRLNPKSVKAHYQLGLLLARMGRKAEADTQLDLAKSLREEDLANSRLQLRLLDPGQ